jgi:hypothetical protein
VDANGPVRATNTGDIFGAADGLTKVSEVFVETLGREMGDDALKTLVFLQQNGSPDLAMAILAQKRYQASAGDMTRFIEKLSPAQHLKDMMETQAAIQAKKGGGLV